MRRLSPYLVRRLDSQFRAWPFWAPRNRIRERRRRFHEGLWASSKCGAVDGVHFSTGGLNLTSNSETFYEVVSIGRYQPAAAASVRAILDGWWSVCKPMVADDLFSKKSATEQQSPADTSLN